MRTPLMENEILNDRLGGRVLMKAEMLQHCGSFKFRGAFNRLSQLTAAERKAGVLAWSSGNHAQGVARAARHFDIPAVIVMPADAPALKVEKVRAYGAQIITYDRYREDREAIGRPLAAEKGYALAPSYDHVDIIEGQGTAALEAAQQADARGLTMDDFVICCGGGGLTAGCATILKEISPDTAITIAEPEGFAESWASVSAGTRCHADITQMTECDAIATPTPGQLTLPIMQALVTGGVSLTPAEVRDAMVFAFKYLKLVLEPGGAVALAAVLAGHVPVRDKVVGLTLSGGNVDPDLFARILNAHSEKPRD
ncbi:MAG: threonine/serine dehydratase [Pseudomonadota bacterium]